MLAEMILLLCNKPLQFDPVCKIQTKQDREVKWFVTVYFVQDVYSLQKWRLCQKPNVSRQRGENGWPMTKLKDYIHPHLYHRLPVGPQENNLISLCLTFFFCKSGRSNFLPDKGAVKPNSQALMKHMDVTGRLLQLLTFNPLKAGSKGCALWWGDAARLQVLLQWASSLSSLLWKYHKVKLHGYWEIMTKAVPLQHFLRQDSEKFFLKKQKKPSKVLVPNCLLSFKIHTDQSTFTGIWVRDWLCWVIAS